MDPAEADGPGLAARRAPRPAALGVGIFLAVLLLGALTGAGSATVPAGPLNTSNDTTGPAVGNLTKVDDTTVELTITDDEGVDEGGIDGADLFVSDGRIDNVTVAENGSNATVTVDLAAKLDTDQLGVAVADSASIDDEAGNELDASGDVWRYVDGMDAVAPTIRLFQVDNGSGDRIEATLRTTEDLSETSVRLYGPADRWLTLENFTKPSGISEYVTSVEPPATGSYRVTVVNVTDAHGNTWESGRNEEIAVDVVAPTAVAGVDFGASEGRTIAFDANRSSDDSAIRALEWDFGDGTNATARQPVHTFEPGNYTVTLTVTDTFGNVGTDRLELDLTDGNVSSALVGDPGARASISGDAGASVIVNLPRASAGDPIEIARRSGEPLASTDAVSLDRLTVTLSRNDTLGLGIEATDAAAVSDVAGEGVGEPLGGLTVVHDAADSAFDAVRFRVGVSTDRVDAAGVEPESLELYRYHDGRWSPLATTYLNASNGSHRYRATAPGLSRFAIAPATDETETTPTATPATPTPTETAAPEPAAEVRVAKASLNRSAVPVGGAVTVKATVRNDGDAAAEYTAGLAVDGTVVETRSVAVPPGTSSNVSFAYRPDGNGTRSLTVNGTAAGTLTVGDGGGGNLLGFLGVLPLGLFLDLLTYVGGALTAVFLLLKATALYLGY
jgi:PKD repeat protein